MDTTPLIFVLYDGITNSVFESQVKKLLQKKAQENPYRPIHLVTFESKITHTKKNFKNIHVTYLKLLPFIGWPTLLHTRRQLKSFLHLFPEYTIIARGPLAGIITQKSISKKACKQFIIQARGLLEQEYAYVQSQKKQSRIMCFFHRIRTAQLHAVETKAYNSLLACKTIEAVSPALKEHIVREYDIASKNITVARDDIPPVINAEQKKAWRIEIRKKLSIPENWNVYCYNGSAKPWQKPETIINFFRDSLEKDPNSFLLILTTDKAVFETLIGTTFSAKQYAIISITHDEVYQYLCAADYGLLFRDKHIINWISRPTKALEYHAAGLEIIHNDTINCLIDNII